MTIVWSAFLGFLGIISFYSPCVWPFLTSWMRIFAAKSHEINLQSFTKSCRSCPLRSVIKGHWIFSLGSSKQVLRLEGLVVKAATTTTISADKVNKIIKINQVNQVTKNYSRNGSLFIEPKEVWKEISLKTHQLAAKWPHKRPSTKRLRLWAQRSPVLPGMRPLCHRGPFLSTAAPAV